jgi:hypothetical protein
VSGLLSVIADSIGADSVRWLGVAQVAISAKPCSEITGHLFHLKLKAHSSSDLIFRRDGRTINKSSPFAQETATPAQDSSRNRRTVFERFGNALRRDLRRLGSLRRSACGFDRRGVGEFAARRASHISRHSTEESQEGQDHHQNKGENRAEYDLVYRFAAIDRTSKSLHKFVDPMANHSSIFLSISAGSRRHAPFVIGSLAVIMLSKSAAFGSLGWSVYPLPGRVLFKRRGFLCVEKLALPPTNNVFMSKTLHSYLLHIRPLSVSRLRLE